MSEDKTYRTIDLFAGIGGIRLGFEETERVTNVWSNEIDKYACKTYEAFWGENPQGDITKINPKEIPNHDILLGGFPCQAFSIAGHQKGFEDTRGTLFYYIAEILNEKKPEAFLLENVKHLMNHDGGNTYETIMRVLNEDLGYFAKGMHLNAYDFGCAQIRDRVYIVGFRDKWPDFEFPKGTNKRTTLKDVLETKPVPEKYFLSTQYLKTLKAHRKRHEEKGHGFGFEIKELDEPANTLVCGGMGRERNLIIDKKPPTPYKTAKKGGLNKEYIRSLTPLEWCRIQGFPDEVYEKAKKAGVSDTQLYKQFGNSVCVPVINAIAERLVFYLDTL